jgi:hypothetical protein
MHTTVAISILSTIHRCVYTPPIHSSHTLLSYTPLIHSSLLDPQSIAAKTAYLKQKGLGGFMYWFIGGDDDQNTLLSTMSEGLAPSPSPPSPTPTPPTSTYKCVNTQCVKNDGGLPLKTCQQLCG